jgi:hypothetical protein
MASSRLNSSKSQLIQKKKNKRNFMKIFFYLSSSAASKPAIGEVVVNGF